MDYLPIALFALAGIEFAFLAHFVLTHGRGNKTFKGLVAFFFLVLSSTAAFYTALWWRMVIQDVGGLTSLPWPDLLTAMAVPAGSVWVVQLMAGYLFSRGIHRLALATTPRRDETGPMHRFMEWLGDEASGFRTVLGYIVFASLVDISLDYTVRNALINWGIVERPKPMEVGDYPFKYLNMLRFVTMFVWGPIKEEVMFRVLPLAPVIAFVSTSPKRVFGIMAAFAALFGAIHPYGLIGKVTVAISGFLFGLVFLKCGGLKKRFVKASACAMAAHGVSNLFGVLDVWWQYFEDTL